VEECATAHQLLRSAGRILVLSGAGLSTGSGIPDFRGPQGLWTTDPGAEMLSSYDRYVADEQVRIAAWEHRATSPIFSARPNAGHRALLELDQRGTLSGIITQNIDGLHLAVGHAPNRVVEIHGQVREARCLSCSSRFPMQEVLDRVHGGEADPRCPRCGGILKSATISFGEALRQDDLDRAERLAISADVFMVVGSSLAVYPVAGLVPLAVRHGAQLLIANAEPTPFDHLAEVVLRGDLVEVLPKICAA